MVERLASMLGNAVAVKYSVDWLLVFLSGLLLAGAWRISRGGTLHAFGREETLPLRALLALFVVLTHVDKAIGCVLRPVNIFHWATPAVAVFFFLSGYGLFKSASSARAKGTLGEYLRGFPLRAIARLLPPFLVLGPVYALWKFAVGKLGGWRLVKSFMTGAFLDIPYDWYVITLAVLYCAFCLSVLLFRNRGASLALFALTAVYWIVTVACLYHCGQLRKFWWFVTCFSFPVGYLFSEREALIRRLFASKPFAVALALISLAVVMKILGWHAGIRMPVTGRLHEPFFCLIGPMVALVFYSFDGLRHVRPLCVLGAISYEIYLLHGIFIKMFAHLGLHGWIFFGAVLAATIPAAWFLRKFDVAVTKRLSGDRVAGLWSRIIMGPAKRLFEAVCARVSRLWWRILKSRWTRRWVQARCARRGIDGRKVVFVAFAGTCGCNPRYIARALAKKRPDMDIVWLLDPKEFHRLGGRVETGRAVPRRTLRALTEVSSARCLVDNAQCLLLPGMPPKREGQTWLNTWHGSLGLKRLDTASGSARDRVARMGDYDVVLVNSDFEESVFRESVFPKNELLRLGHPRNDVFFLPEAERAEVRRRVKAELGVPASVHFALYAPTFRERDEGIDPLGFRPLSFDAWVAALHERFGGTWMIAVRLHPRDVKFLAGGTLSDSACVVDASLYGDMQELLLAAEAGVTDYSSWIFDYILGGAPAFVYAPDLARYDQARGFCYPISDTPFSIAETEDALCANIGAFDAAQYGANVEAFLRARGCMEDGHASERVADLISRTMGGPCGKEGGQT